MCMFVYMQVCAYIHVCEYECYIYEYKYMNIIYTREKHSKKKKCQQSITRSMVYGRSSYYFCTFSINWRLYHVKVTKMVTKSRKISGTFWQAHSVRKGSLYSKTMAVWHCPGLDQEQRTACAFIP